MTDDIPDNIVDFPNKLPPVYVFGNASVAEAFGDLAQMCDDCEQASTDTAMITKEQYIELNRTALSALSNMRLVITRMQKHYDKHFGVEKL